jgi:hypothetical protein
MKVVFRLRQGSPFGLGARVRVKIQRPTTISINKTGLFALTLKPQT